ncbi:hypothetical protein KC361_g135 [Hortaea werneckii]|nr:hypothetical protein KC361_g135 [Hortaea werneckii]
MDPWRLAKVVQGNIVADRLDESQTVHRLVKIIRIDTSNDATQHLQSPDTRHCSVDLYQSLHGRVYPLQRPRQDESWFQVCQALQGGKTVIHGRAALGINAHEDDVPQAKHKTPSDLFIQLPVLGDNVLPALLSIPSWKDGRRSQCLESELQAGGERIGISRDAVADRMLSWVAFEEERSTGTQVNRAAIWGHKGRKRWKNVGKYLVKVRTLRLELYVFCVLLSDGSTKTLSSLYSGRQSSTRSTPGRRYSSSPVSPSSSVLRPAQSHLMLWRRQVFLVWKDSRPCTPEASNVDREICIAAFDPRGGRTGGGGAGVLITAAAATVAAGMQPRNAVVMGALSRPRDASGSSTWLCNQKHGPWLGKRRGDVRSIIRRTDCCQCGSADGQMAMALGEDEAAAKSYLGRLQSTRLQYFMSPTDTFTRHRVAKPKHTTPTRRAPSNPTS